jgi:predicted RNA binding protein YcfA (HicA-like mRNA interferase family)
MTKLLPINSKDIIRKIKQLGYFEVRQIGSHIRFKHSDQNKIPITIPMHNKDLGRGLLRKIIRDLQISIDEFNNL